MNQEELEAEVISLARTQAIQQATIDNILTVLESFCSDTNKIAERTLREELRKAGVDLPCEEA